MLARLFCESRTRSRICSLRLLMSRTQFIQARSKSPITIMKITAGQVIEGEELVLVCGAKYATSWARWSERYICLGGHTAMIVDRYDPVNLFELVPKLMTDFEPELRELDHLLDDDLILQRIKADLARRAPHSLTRGRHSTPVEVILRLFVVKRLDKWSYEATEQFVGDSLVLRQFCRLYLQPVPDDTTLIRWAKLIGPETLQQINARVVEFATQMKVTRGRKLRVDSTVVETTIHYPTDSALVGDGVRVISRLLHKAKTVLGIGSELGKSVFRSRTRIARRIAQQLHRVARRKGEEAAEDLKHASSKLLNIAKTSRKQAAHV